MFAPEEQQIEICLLKSNLKEIENEMIVQRSALPSLDADNEQKYLETMKALKVVRALNAEMEKLKQENVQLTAKRMQLKQQCDEISKNLENAYQNREKLTGSLKQEEQEIDNDIRKYEDFLQEKADRFRKTHGFYRSALPSLDADNEQKYLETMKALKVVRALNAEMEKLKQENVQLTAKRMQLKQQCDEISKNLENAYQNRDKLTDSLKQEEQEIDNDIRKYEDFLQEKADRFRKTHGFYDEEGINAEIDKVNSVIAELKDGMSKKQSGVDELRARMDAIYPDVPENLLEEIGKSKLENEMKSLTKMYEELTEKRKTVKK